jgi:hypothetical protein
MWVYPRSSYPDRTSPTVEVENYIHKVLDSAATPSPSTGPDPYEGESLE